MSKWPLGVFASIDAGLGVHLEVVHELKVPTIHLHAPQKQSRTPERAAEFSKQLKELGIASPVLRAKATPIFLPSKRPSVLCPKPVVPSVWQS